MSDGMVFCKSCGGTLHVSAPFCPSCGAPQAGAGGGDGIERTFGSSIAMCLSKYATFEGRAPRAEYWWFALFTWAAHIVLAILGAASSETLFGIVSLLFSLAIFLPSLAVTARRLHDTDRSGWWMLIFLVPLVGWILFLVWMCTKGSLGPNRFGPENGGR